MSISDSREAADEQTATPEPRHWAWYWGPVVAYAAMIFLLSSLSVSELDLPVLRVPFGDKLAHAGLYGGFALLAMRAFRHAGGAEGARYAWVLGVVAAALYGLSDELHQVFVPNRHADAWDWLADTSGALVAALSWTRWVGPDRGDRN
jgi:VanZ family protein